jgi:ABC-type molybdate transport system substrate-binding protein
MGTIPVAAGAVVLYAAGSLRGALTDLAAEFEFANGRTVASRFGASGLLKDEIVAGARAGVFASANMEHPQAIADLGKGGPVVMFARNRLCALVRKGLPTTPDDLLARMLDPAIRLGTSTPKADPSGDYAWDVFRRADALKPGAFFALDAKAIQLTGGPSSPPVPGRNVYGALVAGGQADIFLTYRTNALVAVRENPDQHIVPLPEALSVGAEYGLTVIRKAGDDAQRLADYILSVNGQRVLAGHGFEPPAK